MRCGEFCGMRLPRRTATGALVVALAAAGAGGYALANGETAEEPVVRDALAQSKHPRGAKGRWLALSRVVVKPGAELAPHRHQGTQVAFIQRGTLTYSVIKGRVKVRKGAYDERPRLVREIKAGQTGRIRAGQWIVEQPFDHHFAANKGDERVVILIATLLKRGAPPSQPVGPAGG